MMNEIINDIYNFNTNSINYSSESKINMINNLITSASTHINKHNSGYIKTRDKIPNEVEYLQKLRKFHIKYDYNAGNKITYTILFVRYMMILDECLTNQDEDGICHKFYETYDQLYKRYETTAKIMDYIDDPTRVSIIGHIDTGKLNNNKIKMLYDALCSIIIYIYNKIDNTDTYNVHDRFVSLLRKLNILDSYDNTDIKEYIKNKINDIASDEIMMNDMNNIYNKNNTFKTESIMLEDEYQSYINRLEILFIINEYHNKIIWDNIVESYNILKNNKKEGKTEVPSTVSNTVRSTVRSTVPNTVPSTVPNTVKKEVHVNKETLKNNLKKDIYNILKWLNRNLKSLNINAKAFTELKLKYKKDISKGYNIHDNYVDFCKNQAEPKSDDCKVVLDISKQVVTYLNMEKKQKNNIEKLIELGENEEVIDAIYDSHVRKKGLYSTTQGGYTKKRKNNKQRSRKLRR